MLIDNIKVDEGFRGKPYRDTLGFPTIGFGTKLPINKKEAEVLLSMRLEKKKKKLKYRLDTQFPETVWDVLVEMSYQMGVRGLLRFKHMIAALKEQDYKEAAKQGRDSLWYRQTPERAEKLMKHLEELAIIKEV